MEDDFTLLALEEALDNTLNKIKALNAEQKTVTGRMTAVKNEAAKLTAIAAQTQTAEYHIIMGQVHGYNVELGALTDRYHQIKIELEVANAQKIADQEAIRDFKLANLSPEEKEEFLKVEQRINESSQLFQYKKYFLIGVGVLVFSVIAFYTYRHLKNAKW